MFDRFTREARNIMAQARKHAQRLRHDFIGTEHILFGIIDCNACIAYQILTSLGVDPHQLKDKIERSVQVGPELVSEIGSLPFTPRVKKVLELTLECANNLESRDIKSEHLLYGLVRENDGFAAQILLDTGVTCQKLQEIFQSDQYKKGTLFIQKKTRTFNLRVFFFEELNLGEKFIIPEEGSDTGICKVCVKVSYDINDNALYLPDGVCFTVGKELPVVKISV